MAVVRRVLGEGPFTLRDLAEEAGINYGTMRAWKIGKGQPRVENLIRIADALEQKADQLAHHADLLRDLAHERIYGEPRREQ